jgi:hypothetical protein
LQHGVFVATTQASRCPNTAALAQTAHDLDNLGFVQTKADETALLVECLAASRVQATKALHRSRLGFEAAEFLGFTTTRYARCHFWTRLSVGQELTCARICKDSLPLGLWPIGCAPRALTRFAELVFQLFVLGLGRRVLVQMRHNVSGLNSPPPVPENLHFGL